MPAWAVAAVLTICPLGGGPCTTINGGVEKSECIRHNFRVYAPTAIPGGEGRVRVSCSGHK